MPAYFCTLRIDKVLLLTKICAWAHDVAVLSSQAGYTGGANQAGQNFGNARHM